MKKILSVVLCLAMALGCLCGLTACDSQTESPSGGNAPVKQYVTGRYEIQSITWDNGTTSTGDALKEALATMGDIYVELYDDHSATLCMYGNPADMEYNETRMWRAGNEKFSYEFSVKDGKVTLKDNGTTFVLVKK